MRTARRGRRLMRHGAACVAIALLCAACDAGGTFGPPSPVTHEADRIAGLWDLFFWAAVVVSAVVLGLLLWAVTRYRARGASDLPRQTRQHLALEVVWTAIPVAIVVGLFAATYGVERPVDDVSSNADVVVDVTGFNWQWRFTYVGHGVSLVGTPDHQPILVLPQGRNVRFDLTSEDVIHAFYVPGFLFKRDAIPGRTTTFDVVPSTTGDYLGECAEFCGLNHAFMRFTIRIVPASEFDAWIARVGASPSTPPGSA